MGMRGYTTVTCMSKKLKAKLPTLGAAQKRLLSMARQSMRRGLIVKLTVEVDPSVQTEQIDPPKPKIRNIHEWNEERLKHIIAGDDKKWEAANPRPLDKDVG